MRDRPYPLLPAQPLVALVEARGGVSELAGGAQASRRSYTRAKKGGDLTVWQADVLAHALLGLHPWEVWGEAWWGQLCPQGPAPIDTQGACGSVHA